MDRTLASQTPKLVGETVLLKGWVNSKRDHGKITFIDLRDRSGLVQIIGGSDLRIAGPEDVVEIKGLVKTRPENLINPKIATGTIEVEAHSLKIISSCHELPLPIDTDGHDIDETVRLKYRYLDLRRPRLNHNLKLRSQFIQHAREYLFTHDFLEIETPLLTKSTPEGSRDFVVPSRLQPGKFYALPQSPQQYKQLLMIAGFERYFQIARCLRDEDLRADRGFEHSQIDLEMSFVTREDVMALTEGLMIEVFEKLGAKIITKPFPVITYTEAMKKYGSDKFDLRTPGQKSAGKLAFAWVIDFPFFEKTDTGGWTFTHNPFSQPIDKHLDWHLQGKNVAQILTTQYDLVCNGFEVGGGSIRAHDPEVLKATYRTMGYTNTQIQSSIGHMLEAFKYGTPPHGGIAPGIERLLMVLTGEEYLREVQAFPQTGSGQTSVMDAPSLLDPAQLQELGIAIKNNSRK